MKHCMKCGNRLTGMERYINWETLEVVVKKYCDNCEEYVIFEMESKIKDIKYKGKEA